MMVATTEGEQYDVKHTIRHPPEGSGRSRGTCVAVLPSGRECGRRLNWYADVRGRRHWRHNPRPYANY